MVNLQPRTSGERNTNGAYTTRRRGGIHSAQECRLGTSRKDAAKQGKENKPKDRALSYAAAAATIAGGPEFTVLISELSNDKE